MLICKNKSLRATDAEAGASGESSLTQTSAWASFLRRLYVGLVVLYNIIVWVVIIISGVVTVCIALALETAMAAAIGAVMLLIGNGILRATGHHGYVSDSNAGLVGAIGGIIANLILEFVGNSEEEGVIDICDALWHVAASALCGTLSGVIGCAILLHRHADIGGLDVLHASRAGTLGGVILGVPLGFYLNMLVKVTVWTAVTAYSLVCWEVQYGMEMIELRRLGA